MVHSIVSPHFSRFEGLDTFISLYGGLDVPYAAVDGSGRFLYLNPAFEHTLTRYAKAPAECLADVVTTEDQGTALFLSSGRLNKRALPYTGKFHFATSGKAPSWQGLMRMEDFTAAPAQKGVFVLSLLPYRGSNVSRHFLFSEWKEQVEEIGDSFDIQRIGVKTCKILEELADARAVALFYPGSLEKPDGTTHWKRAEQIGQVEFLQSSPETFTMPCDWQALFIDELHYSISDFLKKLRQEGIRHNLEWLKQKGQGFVLACKCRGDLLGLAVAWCDRTEHWREAGELLELISFQTARAIDHAQWFEFTSRSDSRSAELIQNANAIILGLDLQGKLTLWNNKAVEVLGYADEEVLGRRLFDLFGSSFSEASEARAAFQDALATGTSLTEFEATLLDKHYQERHIVWSTNTLYSPHGAPIGLYAIGQDITRRKTLESQLENSEKRYRNLVESTHDLYWVITMEEPEDLESWQITFLNRPLAGIPREEILHRDFEFVEGSLKKRARKHFRRACLEAVALGQPVEHLELQHQSPFTEEVFWFVHDIFPYYEDGILQGVQILSADITERKEIEAQMLQAQKLESVGTLARGVAHDFNNILNGINGFVYLAQQASPESEAVQKYSRMILEQTGRASRLTRQLQAYSRGNPPEKKPLDLNEVLRQTIKMVETGAARKHKVQAELTEELEWVEADRSQVEQVIMNLCINAAEATPKGGKLMFRTFNLKLEKSDPMLPDDKEAGDYSVLQIADTGMGMTPQVKARIFDPFYTTKKTGNGLGLSAVYGIVKAHMGWVRVESEVGVGTCFSLYFPSVDSRHKLLGENTHAEIRGGNETILVVDDERPVRVVAEDILSTLGYRVVVAEDGEAALRIFEERPQAIDLVLMDMAMPRINGRVAAKAMRVIRPDLRVLFSSGYTDEGHIGMLQDDGFQHFLPKPFSMVDLQKKIRKMLDQPLA